MCSPKVGKKVVGCRVAVWWQSDERFYPGTIEFFDGSSKTNAGRRVHRVLYDDGEWEYVPLCEHVVCYSE